MQTNNQQLNIRDPKKEIQNRGGFRALPLPLDPQNILNLSGFIETVTTIPTEAPKTFYESIKIYTDSLTAPATRRLYIYSNKLEDWLYVALST